MTRDELLNNAADFLEKWRNDDHELPIPPNEFGADLAWYADILIDHARGEVIP